MIALCGATTIKKKLVKWLGGGGGEVRRTCLYFFGCEL